MAFVHGSNAAVWIRSTDFTPVLTGWTMDLSVGNSETTTLDDTWKKNIKGTIETTVSFDGFYENAYETNGVSRLANSTAAIITLCPGGSAIGDLARLIDAWDTASGTSGSADDVEAYTFAAIANGAVEFGHVLHDYTEDTNTTTGASQDGLAATSTGWTMHVHYAAPEGGTWVVKLQDSADNSNWLDVSSAASSAISAAGVQRIQSSTSTATVRRYVRYVATRTGGSAGNGLTFALAFARTKTT